MDTQISFQESTDGMNHRRVRAHQLIGGRKGSCSSVAHPTTEPQLRSDEHWFFGFSDPARADLTFE
ncbi:MAG: hypothetical protein ABIQ82_01920 [Variovorax sp.]